MELIGWIIVGLLVGILVAIINLGKELAIFRIHFDESSLSDYDRRNMVDTIGRMGDTLREISINTARE